ncbi:MAG TPA: CHAT domain-containing protein, partial [Vicinamibacteria bacterium]|nr:CHAT domain-containing protein [Vicinamibacteria bacterium]
PRLQGAADEAIRIARWHEGSEILLGPVATQERFLAGVRKAQLIHFAGHAVTNPELPMLSFLVLAPGSGDSGVLAAHEIQNLDLSRTRLVVLAACSTATGEISVGEGVLSLARPFLAAGASAVVASLWDVDDEASTSLLVAFHRLLASGMLPAEALRSAQVEFLDTSEEMRRRPDVWAAFQFIGGL